MDSIVVRVEVPEAHGIDVSEVSCVSGEFTIGECLYCSRVFVVRYLVPELAVELAGLFANHPAQTGASGGEIVFCGA